MDSISFPHRCNIEIEYDITKSMQFILLLELFQIKFDHMSTCKCNIELMLIMFNFGNYTQIIIEVSLFAAPIHQNRTIRIPNTKSFPANKV